MRPDAKVGTMHGQMPAMKAAVPIAIMGQKDRASIPADAAR